MATRPVVIGLVLRTGDACGIDPASSLVPLT